METRDKMNTSEYKIIKRKLEAEGVSGYTFDKFKLYNADTFDKFTRQAEINESIAIRDYKQIIQKEGKRQ